MPTQWLVAYSCDKLPCNNRTAVVKLVNMTSQTGDGKAEEDYDEEGAMHFIVATVLVYSLIGVFGMLLLRIRRSATKSQRTVALQEESLQRYLKHQNQLLLEGRRDVMKKDLERMNQQLSCSSFSRQTSLDSALSASSGQLSPTSSCLCTPELSISNETLQRSPRSPGAVNSPFRYNTREYLPPLIEGQDEPDVTSQSVPVAKESASSNYDKDERIVIESIDNSLSETELRSDKKEERNELLVTNDSRKDINSIKETDTDVQSKSSPTPIGSRQMDSDCKIQIV